MSGDDLDRADTISHAILEEDIFRAVEGWL
jgi:hypothetical protein